jgi:phosphoglycerate kinase
MQNTTWRDHSIPDVRTLKGKRVLVRVDWNMPIDHGAPADLSRFNVTVPFLKNLHNAGAKIIIMTHFGEEGQSLSPIAAHAVKELSFLKFDPSFNFDELENHSRGLLEGEGLLLENVRLFNGETENLSSLASSFARLGDVFINDAFSVSHRAHASVVGVASIMLSYLGPTCLRELEHLERALTPKLPALFIVGGAKISTKLDLIKEYLNKGVKVFVGGAMVHNIWKERGIEIGNSLYDPNYSLAPSFYNHPLLLTPEDVVLSNGEVVHHTKIPKDGVVVDCGKETVKLLSSIMHLSNTVIVNGPLGLYEKGWLHGTEALLNELGNAQVSSYIGGGDTVTVAHSLNLLQKFTFVSLGGGAMLDYLSSGTLKGIDAVTK